MVEVAQEIITEYLEDSTNKALLIDSNYDIQSINRYYGMSEPNMFRTYRNDTAQTYNGFSVWATPSSSDFTNYVDFTIDKWRYINISFGFYVSTDTDLTLPGHWQITYNTTSGTIKYVHMGSGLLSTRRTIFPQISFVKTSDFASIKEIAYILDSATPSTKLILFNGSIQITQSANPLFSDFRLYPGSDYDIDANGWWLRNSETLYEDFTLTESLCSQDNVKFGLCEAAHCEFSEIGINSIKVGDKFSVRTKTNVSISQDIPDSVIKRINWAMFKPNSQESRTHTESMYHLMPVYQYTTGYYYWTYGMVGAFRLSSYYNKFFDGRYIGTAFELKITVNSYTSTVKPTYVKFSFYYLGMNGKGYYYDTEYFLLSDFERDFVRVENYLQASSNQVVGLKGICIGFYKADKSLFAQSDEITATFDYRRLQYHSLLENETIPDYDASAYYLYKEVHNQPNSLTDYLEPWSGDGSIPLGHYYVESVTNKYRHNLVEHQITGYDNLLTLGQNAADWYTRYMFGVDMDGYTSNGFEYARQIYSTYWNYATSIGLDSRNNYIENQIAYYEYFTDIKPNHISGKVLSWTSSDPIKKIRYAYFNVSNPDPSKMYMVSFVNSGGDTDEATIALLPQDYFTQVDALGRGVATNGSILIEATVTGGTVGYCVNKNDYFMIPADCTSFIVYTPVYTEYDNGTSYVRLLDNLTIYEVTEKPRLVNGDIRLCYYNYGTKDIFACESNITGRDVVRSLLEVCGCFFRLDRLHGLPEFVYPTKGGLYPSNTLLPADDLYPRSGTDSIFPMGKYISVIAENYEVKNYGRIQILKNIKSSDTQSVVEWQYEGDSDEPSTYIIDDNIFYCAEEMEYDYDGMPEVAEMLKNMWNVVSNLGYVPNVTETLGAPWLECGDRIGLLTYNGGFESFIFRRTLKGIQNLRDTYESEGDELTEAISNFGY